MQTKKTSKELINCFKDYIDSYALLYNAFENERNKLNNSFNQ